MSFVTISYCLDRDSGAIASIEPSVSLLHIWIAEMGDVGEEEVAVSCREDSGVKHDLPKHFKRRGKQYAFLFSLFMLLHWKLECLVANSLLQQSYFSSSTDYVCPP